jgi:glycosyltransferase involved in cell wall biosynthesis
VNRFDVVHIHALFSFSSVAAALAATWKGVPYVLRPLGTLNAYGIQQRRPLLKRLSFRFVESWVLSEAAVVHFTSQAEWDEAKSLGVEFSGVVIPLGLEDNSLAMADATTQSHRTSEMVLFLSRLDPKKNIEGLLRAFALLRSRYPNAILQIAGNGSPEYVASLKQVERECEIEDRVQWVGHVAGEQKLRLLREASVFVLPSFSENFGIAVAEALFAGLPCVVGEGVAISKVVQEASAGMCIAPDAESISKALGVLLGNEEMRVRMGVNARHLAQKEFSAEMMAKRLCTLYEQLILNRRGRSLEPEQASRDLNSVHRPRVS